jgi:hypothetical protein
MNDFLGAEFIHEVANFAEKTNCTEVPLSSVAWLSKCSGLLWFLGPHPSESRLFFRRSLE